MPIFHNHKRNSSYGNYINLGTGIGWRTDIVQNLHREEGSEGRGTSCKKYTTRCHVTRGRVGGRWRSCSGNTIGANVCDSRVLLAMAVAICVGMYSMSKFWSATGWLHRECRRSISTIYQAPKLLAPSNNSKD